MAVDSRKVKFDNGYVDTRGQNTYWRDPKDRRSSITSLSRNSHHSPYFKIYPKAWNDYGNTSNSKTKQMKAADLYESWMDDPRASAPPPKTSEPEKETRESPKKKPPKSKYATQPIKPKSKFKYWSEYALEAGDSDSENEETEKSDDANDGANEKDKKKNPSNAAQQHKEDKPPEDNSHKNKDGKKGDKDDQREDEPEDPTMNNEHEEDDDDSYEELEDDATFQEYNSNQQEKDDITNADEDDISDIEDAYPDNETKRAKNSAFGIADVYPEKETQTTPYYSSLGGMPPSPARRVRRYPKKQETGTQYDKELALPGFIHEQAEDVLEKGKGRTDSMNDKRKTPQRTVKPGSRRRSRTNQGGEEDDLDIEILKRNKKEEEKQLKKHSRATGLPGQIDDLDIEMLNRDEKNRQKQMLKQSRDRSRKKFSSALSDPRKDRPNVVTSSSRRNSGDQGASLTPTPTWKKEQKVQRPNKKNTGRNPDTGRGSTNGDVVKKKKKHTASSSSRPVWRPWSSRSKEFGEKKFIDQDD